MMLRSARVSQSAQPSSTYSMLYYMDAIGTLRILHFPDSSCGITCGILLSIDIRTQRHNWSNPFDITDIMRVQKKIKGKTVHSVNARVFLNNNNNNNNKKKKPQPQPRAMAGHLSIPISTQLASKQSVRRTTRSGAVRLPPRLRHLRETTEPGLKWDVTVEENHRKPSKTIENHRSKWNLRDVSYDSYGVLWYGDHDNTVHKDDRWVLAIELRSRDFSDFSISESCLASEIADDWIMKQRKRGMPQVKGVYIQPR